MVDIPFFKKKIVVANKPSFGVVRQKLRSVNKTDNNKFISSVGEEHPFDGLLTEEMYKNIGLVTGIVDKFVTRITGGGFHVKSTTGNKRSEQLIADWIRDTQFQVILEDWVREACVKPGGYLELGGKRDEKINGLKIVDGNTVYVKRDNHGKIIKFNQWFSNKGFTRSSDVISFDPYQIASLHFRQVGSDAYGQGLVYPIRKIIDSLIGLQKDMHTLIHRKANAPLHVKIGSIDGDQAMIPTQSDIDEYANKLYLLTEKSEFVTDPYFDFNVVDFGQIGEKFDAILQHDIDMLVFSTQIPEVLLGRGSVPEGLAKVQGEDFQKLINSFQQRVEKVLEEQVLNRVLNSQGVNDVVEVVWGQPTNSELKSRIDMLKNTLSLMTLSGGLRKAIEKDLASSLGYDEKVVDEVVDQPVGSLSSEERDEFTDQEQPLVPGQNNQQVKKHFHEKLKDNYTLREWLDFDFTRYLEDIKAVIKKEGFIQLSAANIIEEQAGKLSSSQVSKLRKVLYDGFSSGKDLKSIGEAIAKEVQPKDLYEVVDNEISDKLLVSGNKRPMLIARSESTRVAGEGARKNYLDNGITEYSLLAASSACPDCQELNGTIYDVSNNAPVPIHPNCRCTIIPVVKG